jgi:hypothetical protein
MSADWFIDYPISLYFDLQNAQRAQDDMVAALVALCDAIDADASLGGTVFDCAISSATPFVESERKRPLAGYEVVISTFQLVPNT